MTKKTLKTFLVDVERCSGCSLCIIACKDEHVEASYAPWTSAQPETGHFWMNVIPIERGALPRVKMSYLPLLCQHCENAACMKVCPENAIKRRDDGLVWIDSKTCTGCGLCEPACPYGVIFMNKELSIAQKCTGCAHLVDGGSAPRCVQACPHDALLFGDETDSMFSAGKGRAEFEIYHPEYHAAPRVYWRNLPKPWIAGKVIDAASDEVLKDAAVAAIDLFDDGSVVTASDAFGDFWIRALQKNRKYKIAIRKDGYQDYFAVVTVDDEQDLGTISLQRL